jgi:hypothetical protein
MLRRAIWYKCTHVGYVIQAAESCKTSLFLPNHTASQPKDSILLLLLLFSFSFFFSSSSSFFFSFFFFFSSSYSSSTSSSSALQSFNFGLGFLTHDSSSVP